MQKWEYLTIYVFTDKGILKVQSENNTSFGQGKWTTDFSKCPVFYEYARQKGLEGWEITGTPSGGMDQASAAWFHVIFKRPI